MYTSPCTRCQIEFPFICPVSEETRKGPAPYKTEHCPSCLKETVFLLNGYLDKLVLSTPLICEQCPARVKCMTIHEAEDYGTSLKFFDMKGLLPQDIGVHLPFQKHYERKVKIKHEWTYDEERLSEYKSGPSP